MYMLFKNFFFLINKNQSSWGSSGVYWFYSLQNPPQGKNGATPTDLEHCYPGLLCAVIQGCQPLLCSSEPFLESLGMPLPTLRTSPYAYHVPSALFLPWLEAMFKTTPWPLLPPALHAAQGKQRSCKLGSSHFMWHLSWEIFMTSPGHCGYSQHPLDDARWEDIKLFWTHTSQVRKYGASKIKTHYLTGNRMLQRAKIAGIGSTPKLNRKCSNINIRF